MRLRRLSYFAAEGVTAIQSTLRWTIDRSSRWKTLGDQFSTLRAHNPSTVSLTEATFRDLPAGIVPREHVGRVFLGVLADHLTLLRSDSLKAVTFLCMLGISSSQTLTLIASSASQVDLGNNTDISLWLKPPMLTANGQHGRRFDYSYRSETHRDRSEQRLDRGAARNPRQRAQTGRACQDDQGDFPFASRSQA
jgi:hypothetical protein